MPSDGIVLLHATFSASKYASRDQLTVVGKKVLDRVQGVPGGLLASLWSVVPRESETTVVLRNE
jgi:hypothetical protein